jgi:hypothetical protein
MEFRMRYLASTAVMYIVQHSKDFKARRVVFKACDEFKPRAGQVRLSGIEIDLDATAPRWSPPWLRLVGDLRQGLTCFAAPLIAP